MRHFKKQNSEIFPQTDPVQMFFSGPAVILDVPAIISQPINQFID